MTAIDMTSEALAPQRPLRAIVGPRVLLRYVQRMVGTGMFLAALLLWIAPGSNWGAEIMLMKLAISCVMILAGIGLFQASALEHLPTVEIDVRKGEVRMVRKDVFGSRILMETCAFQDIARAEQDGCNLRIWGPQNRELVDISLSDFDAMNEVVRKLRAFGKLA